MQIGLSAADKEHTITHDLNFAQERYESKHVIVRFSFQYLGGLFTDYLVDIQKPQARPFGCPARIGSCSWGRERSQI